MKSLALGLGITLLLGQDPAVPPEWADLMREASSIDPVGREAARSKLQKAVEERKDLLRKLARSDDQALVISGLLGDVNSRGRLVKLLKSGDVELRRGAAEALSLLAGSTGSAELADCLEDPDLAVRLAAVRALAGVKQPAVQRVLKKARESERLEEALLGAYGLELQEPQTQVGYISDNLKEETGWAVALNLESVVDRLWRTLDKSNRRDRKLQDSLENLEMSEAGRDALGLLCLRAGILDPVDLFTYLRWPASRSTAWAFRRIPRLRSMRRSTLASAVVRMIEERSYGDPSEEEEIRHYDALEGLLAKVCGRAKPEGDLRERAGEYRAWLDRVLVDLIDADVDRAIEDGVAWLRRTQRKDGTWQWCTCGRYGGYTDASGITALCGYTLLKMGVAPDDPAIAEAATWLLKQPLAQISNSHTYSVSLEAMFFAELLSKPKKTERRTVVESPQAGGALKRVQECVDWLIEGRAIVGDGSAWTYNKAGGGKTYDHSNTQFAVLGLLAGQNAGIKVPAATWQQVLDHWKEDQLDDGRWTYSPPPADTPKSRLAGSTSMTGAGISCVLIAEAALQKTTTEKAALVQEAARRAIARWEANYPIVQVARFRDGHVGSVYYDFYSVERAMMLAGIPRLGGRDWYHDGALYILWNQMDCGAWLDTSDTCFALLFLKKAYVPVMTGK